MTNLEQSIRERAYELWLETGRQHGNAEAHWLAAQRQILGASLGELGRVAEAATKPKKAWKKKGRAA